MDYTLFVIYEYVMLGLLTRASISVGLYIFLRKEALLRPNVPVAAIVIVLILFNGRFMGLGLEASLMVFLPEILYVIYKGYVMMKGEEEKKDDKKDDKKKTPAEEEAYKKEVLTVLGCAGILFMGWACGAFLITAIFIVLYYLGKMNKAF